MRIAENMLPLTAVAFTKLMEWPPGMCLRPWWIIAMSQSPWPVRPSPKLRYWEIFRNPLTIHGSIRIPCWPSNLVTKIRRKGRSFRDEAKLLTHLLVVPCLFLPRETRCSRPGYPIWFHFYFKRWQCKFSRACTCTWTDWFNFPLVWTECRDTWIAYPFVELA